MYCKNCGKEVIDGLLYCPNCGCDLEDNGKTTEKVDQDLSLIRQASQIHVDVKRFSFLGLIVLTFFTFGIYNLYFFARTTADHNKLAVKYNIKGIRSFGAAFLLGLITFGIYTIYWMYKYIELAINIAEKKGERISFSSPALLFIVYLLFNIIALYFIVEVNNACANNE